MQGKVYVSLSDSGYLPDGIDSNVIYFAITNDSTNETLNANQIKLASKNDALLGGSETLLQSITTRVEFLRFNQE